MDDELIEVETDAELEVPEPVPSEPDPEPKKALVSYGGAAKALGDGKIGGYLVKFSDEKKPDIFGTFFDAKTDFGDAAVLTGKEMEKKRQRDIRSKRSSMDNYVDKNKADFKEYLFENQGKYSQAVKDYLTRHPEVIEELFGR